MNKDKADVAGAGVGGAAGAAIASTTDLGAVFVGTVAGVSVCISYGAVHLIDRLLKSHRF